MRAPQGAGASASCPASPSLDRDDVDGRGPEYLDPDIPESGVADHIGVHYWKYRGFGPSLAEPPFKGRSIAIDPRGG